MSVTSSQYVCESCLSKNNGACYHINEFLPGLGCSEIWYSIWVNYVIFWFGEANSMSMRDPNGHEAMIVGSSHVCDSHLSKNY
jgi:hypothetical protein